VGTFDKYLYQPFPSDLNPDFETRKLNPEKQNQGAVGTDDKYSALKAKVCTRS
jgi:hypothetical protein